MQDRRADGELVAAARAGSQEAFGELVARYKDAVFGVAFHRLGDFEEARDAAQETFVKVFLNLARLRDPGAFGAWVCRIADGTASDAARRPKREVSLDAGDEAASRLVSPQAAAERAELSREIAQALQTLSGPTRLALILHCVNGYSHAEVARFIGATPGAVKTRISRAKSRLREEMVEVVEHTLKRERPTLKCEFTHPQLQGSVFTMTANMPEDELRRGLEERGYRIQNVRIMSDEELAAEARRGRRIVATAMRNAIVRALKEGADAFRLSLPRPERWCLMRHLKAGRWRTVGRMATAGGRPVPEPGEWRGSHVFSVYQKKLARMAGVELRDNAKRQTGKIRLRYRGRERSFTATFTPKAITLGLRLVK